MSRPSVLVAALAQRVLSCAQNQDDYPGIAHHWLQRLANNLKRIQLAPHAAESTELISDAYDAHNVLDRLEYRILQLRAEGARGIQRQVVRLYGSLAKFRAEVAERAPLHLHEFVTYGRWSFHSFSAEHLIDLSEVVISCDKIIKRYVDGIAIPERAGQLEMCGLNRAVPERAPVSLGEPELVGREREKECILRFLMRTAANVETCSYVNIDLLPIVGVGGVGKTALARWVYNEEIVTQHFDFRAWVRASEAVHLERLMIAMVEPITTEKSREFGGPQDLGNIRKTLRKGLTGKRFLIVLDDVRVEEEAFSNWEMLLETLKVGKEGSKVLITTRNRTVATSTGTFNRLYLKVLKDADCWSLFKQCAFGDKNPEDHLELKGIGMTIAMRLGGLPLEVKLLGGLLKSNLNASFWRSILKEYSMLEANSEPFPSVRISYAYLPEHLKQCFAYSSIFSRDYGFQKDRLVRIWMALGYILPSEGKKIEDIGREYFDDLSQRFFFEKKQYQDGYVIHDKLYDVACRAAKNECHVIKDDTCETLPMELRHLYVCTNSLDIIRRFSLKLKRIHSLIIQGQFDADVLVNNLKVFKELRVLVLSEVCIKSLPESIGNLIHLRYLELHKIDVVELPESVCRLYHLEGLDVSYCVKLQHLPKGLSKLSKLRLLKQ